jgi:hypothetical protein
MLIAFSEGGNKDQIPLIILGIIAIILFSIFFYHAIIIVPYWSYKLMKFEEEAKKNAPQQLSTLIDGRGCLTSFSTFIFGKFL